MTVERKTIDGREAERRDIVSRRKSTDSWTFTFTGAGPLTAGEIVNWRFFDRPGGTLLLTKSTTTFDISTPNDPKATLTVTAAEKQALANDDASDAVKYFAEVELIDDAALPAIWINGDWIVSP